jgi:mono/diheme cytochrome c family protein
VLAFATLTALVGPGFPSTHAAGPQAPPAVTAVSARAAIDQYCVTCHNQRLKTGGLTLDDRDPAHVSGHAALWENVVRKLRAGAMPPAGARQPGPAAIAALAGSLEAELDRAAASRPDPGPSRLRRLNRAEYAAAIRDLLALEVDAASLLPPDNSAYGFDNIAEALGVSPSLQERYLNAAERISALAVGDPQEGPTSHTYLVRQDLSQNQHVEGLPLGTVGGTLVRHVFPLDGEYQFQAKLYRTNFENVRGIEHPHQIDLTLDGARIHSATIGGYDDLAAAFEKPKETADAIDARLSVRTAVKAGPHGVSIAFVESFPVVNTTRLRPFLKSAHDTLDWTGRPHIQALTITGPFLPTGAGDTPSRRRIFVCQADRSPKGFALRAGGAPGVGRGGVGRGFSRAEETACAKQIVGVLARRAFRRPVADAELRPLMTFFEAARREGGFESGIQRALQVILASPKFVFRIEADRAANPSNPLSRVSDIELASRLSFFLWSSLPDDDLLRVATEGRLSQPAVLEREVRRMLADPRAEALVANFFGQWLQLRNVRSLQPNSDVFPDFDDNLRRALRRETELLIDTIIRDDRSVVDLLTSDFTFVNERLARHYGIPNVYGSQFRRVAVADEARRGILGHASVLAVTSHATRTSPVVRGKWVLENILGTPPPPPLPNVPALKEPEKGQRPKTMREQMAEHRSNPVCASCHNAMDPIGFALENFDAVGAWRTRDAGQPIDASGELADGTHVDGVIALRKALTARPERFVGTMTEKLLTYALGRGLTPSDMPVVRSIVHEAGRHDYRFSSLVLGVVNSMPFRMRRASGDAPDVTGSAQQ